MSRARRPYSEKVLTKHPVDSTFLSEALKSGLLQVDEEGNLRVVPVMLIDPTTNPMGTGPTQPNVAVAINPTNKKALLTNAVQYFYNFDNGNLEPARTPTVYRNVTALNAGSTAVWTPGAGLRWRLMGICINLMKATTAAAACKLEMLDVAADIGIGVDICAAAMAATPGGLILLQGDFKNGILAAAPATALNVNLSSALAAGGVSVQVWGTEE